MKEIYQFVVENIASKSFEQEKAVELLKLLKADESKVDDIAVIGMNGQFPKANNIAEFWENIRKGTQIVEEFPKERQKDVASLEMFNSNEDETEVDSTQAFRPGSFLDNIADFDFGFFDMVPRQAVMLDPHHRLILESFYHVIEDAGYSLGSMNGTKTGVYVGFSSSLLVNYADIIKEVEPESLQMAITGNLPAIIPSRISYLLNLKGPAILVDTSCSSSLVAIHEACRAIKHGDCEVALVGGAKVHLAPTYADHNIGIESDDGYTRTFDSDADGTGLGEGVGSIMLKSRGRAIKDGDHIYAIIKGSAVNQDGLATSITSPNPVAQTEVIAEAWKNADINPETITYIEAHGTATKIGDPLEMEGIDRAFKQYTDKKAFCAVGTSKANIGHLFEGSGIASFIKSVLSIQHGVIPPLANFKSLNKNIEIEDSSLYINQEEKPWITDNMPKRCGISAFGFSGTNCHLILEEAPEQPELSKKSATTSIFVLSAKSKNSLEAYVKSYNKFLENNDSININNLCYTATTGREHYQHRLAMTVDSLEELKEKMSKIDKVGPDNLLEHDIFYGEHNRVAESRDRTSEIDISEAKLNKLKQEATDRIKAFIDSGKKSGKELETIGKLYIRGTEVDWNTMYEGEQNQKVSLPVYPFDKTRCWMKTPKSMAEQLEDGKRLYQTAWNREELTIKEKNLENQSVLIFNDNQGLGDQVAEKFKQNGQNVIRVNFGNEFQQLDSDSFIIGNREEDHHELLNHVDIDSISQVIHMANITDDPDPANARNLDQFMETGTYAVFFFVKSVYKKSFKSSFELILIANNINRITQTESTLNPLGMTLFGFGRAIKMEYPQLSCRSIDIDEHTSIDQLYSEITESDAYYTVAYRENLRYAEEFRNVGPDSLETAIATMKSDGVYVVTGGSGGIGLEVAKFIASKERVNLALINRSELPPRDQWKKIEESEEVNEKLLNQIRSIQQIEANGSTVTVYSSNISDQDTMRSIFEQLRQKFGSINGIVHAAGVAGTCLIEKMERENIEDAIEAKIRGTYVLDQITESDSMDFFILFSSVASIFSAPGQGDYVVANSFLDAFAEYRNSLGKRTTAINWVIWKETGMAVTHNANFDTAFKALTNEQGIEAFEVVLQKNIAGLFVGELNYSSPLLKNILQSTVKFSDPISEKIEKAKLCWNQSTKKQKQKKEQLLKELPSVALIGKEEETAYSDIEKSVATIWGDVLGVDSIDVQEGFFQIGGDSMLAMTAMDKIQKEFQVSFDIRDFFNHPTVENIASIIKKEMSESSTL